MKAVSYFLALTAYFFCLTHNSLAQSGNIIERGDVVLDPNQDEFVSETNAGFSGDGYDVDEFEIKMFGIPIFGDGEALRDVDGGPPCGVSDLSLDQAGYALYASYDPNQNLVFRFRLAGNNPSVQSYTIVIDTDQAVGPADENSNSINPGFEIEITLIHNFGVYIYAIDGIESCPNPVKAYPVETNQQKSVSSMESCGDPDYFVDFYIPFADLEEIFGIDEDTQLRFAGVTNISATCMLDGKISDIGGVDDTEYDGCFSCAVLDLTENQCPTGVSNLCEACAGFPEGATETPDIEKPVLVGDVQVKGTAEADAFIYLQLFSEDGTLDDLDTVMADTGGNWMSNEFSRMLNFGDSIVVDALLPGKCQSGLNNAGLSFAIVSPNQPPEISGSATTITYIENQAPILVADDILVTDDNGELVSGSVYISANYEAGLDFIEIGSQAGISVEIFPEEGRIALSGTASVDAYQQILRSVSFYNTSEAPSLAIRSVSFKVNDALNPSNSFSRGLIVTGVNDAPEIIVGGEPVDTLFYSTDEDISLEVCLQPSDVDSEVFEFFSSNVSGNHGQVDLLPGLCLNFTPEEDFFGDEFVELTICDDGNPTMCTDVVIAIDVSPVNDPPQVIEDEVQVDSLTFTTLKNHSFDFCLEGFDIEGNDISITDISFIENSESIIMETEGLCFTYNPADDFVGGETIEITICDNGDPTECSMVIIEIEVVPFNTAPVFGEDTVFVTMNKNTTREICVEATDEDGDELSVTVESAEENSTIETTNALCFNYTPPFNFFGKDILEVIVCDDVFPALCDTVTVKINIESINNPPGIWIEGEKTDTLYFSTKVNQELTYCLEAEDPDGDNVVLEEVNVEAGTGVSIPTEGLCLSFMPQLDYTGPSTTTINLCDDGVPVACSDVTVIIDVLPQNSPPTILFDGLEVDTLFFVTSVDLPLEFCLEAMDPDNDAVNIEGITEITGGGFYIPGDDELCLEFIPENGFVGKDIHTITVCDDGDPEACDEVVVVIDVRDVNHAPFILAAGQPTDTISVRTPGRSSLILCVDAQDQDGDALRIQDLGQQAENGVLNYDFPDDLCLSYTPDQDFLGTDHFVATVCDDGNPILCDTAVIAVDVYSTNTAPQILIDGISVDSVFVNAIEGEPFLQSFSLVDDENDQVTIFSKDVLLGKGRLELTLSKDIEFEYLPEINSAGDHRVSFEVCDDGLPILCDSVVVNLNVIALNHPPVAVNDSLITIERQPISGNVLLNDSDPDNDSVVVLVEFTVQPVSGEIEINPDGEFEFIPYNDFTGITEIPYTIADVSEDQLSSDGLIVIEVEPADRSIIVFEALSPNGDGRNDFWLIRGIEFFPNNVVRVFDRWNNFIFEARGYDNSDVVWKGETNKSLYKKDVSDGTYFYIIIPGDGSPQLTGKIVLKR